MTEYWKLSADEKFNRKPTAEISRIARLIFGSRVHAKTWSEAWRQAERTLNQ